MAPELNRGGGSDGVLCFNEEMENKSIILVFISTFGAELDSREGDDFDKEVLNDSKGLVVNSTFGADVACRDDKDDDACTVVTELTSGDGNNDIPCFDEIITESTRLVVTSVELTFGGCSGCISCFDK